MVDCSVSRAPEALLPKRGGPVKMEEPTLMALLECPLCFEQLDVSAKVLPCQHTFCMPCLQRQEATRSQLLCPECRAPVPSRTVEELPANPLLVRLLEGLRGSPGPSRDRQTARYATPLSRGGLRVREGQQQQESQRREKQGHSEVSAQPRPNPPHIYENHNVEQLFLQRLQCRKTTIFQQTLTLWLLIHQCLHTTNVSRQPLVIIFSSRLDFRDVTMQELLVTVHCKLLLWERYICYNGKTNILASWRSCPTENRPTLCRSSSPSALISRWKPAPRFTQILE